jgi:hypothetical protein
MARHGGKDRGVVEKPTGSGKRLLPAITLEELRRIQTLMKARRSKLQMRNGQEPRAWAPGTINRHFVICGTS